MFSRIPRISELRSRAGTFWSRSFTNRLIVVCVLVFAAQSAKLFFAESMMLNYAWIRAGFFLNFFGYGFLHGSWLHLALNMVALYFAGNAVEQYDSRGTAAAVFLGGTAAGGAAWTALVAGTTENPFSQTLVGASAGIAALFAYFSIAHRREDVRALIFFLIPVHMRAWLIFVLLLALSAAGLAFSEIPSLRAAGIDVGAGPIKSVAHSAHIGGLLFGAAFALVAEFARERFGNVRYFRR